MQSEDAASEPATPYVVMSRHSVLVGGARAATPLELNKAVVVRFNKEVIEQGDTSCLRWLMDQSFVDHSAAGADSGPSGMLYTFNHVLRRALSDLRVELHDQIAEGDKVTTRKTVSGAHTGELLGVPATNREVVIDVIDIVRLRNRKYLEYWGSDNLQSVLASLRAT